MFLMFNFCVFSIRLAIEVVLQFLGYITFLPSTERHGLITGAKLQHFLQICKNIATFSPNLV